MFRELLYSPCKRKCWKEMIFSNNNISIIDALPIFTDLSSFPSIPPGSLPRTSLRVQLAVLVDLARSKQKTTARLASKRPHLWYCIVAKMALLVIYRKTVSVLSEMRGSHLERF